MPVDTLLSISQRAASRGASRIYSIGDLPYHLAAPILAKVPSPAQLHEIEQSSPQIIGCIDDLWLAFLKRDVPDYESKPHRPANPASWFKVYKKLKKQSEADMTAGQEKLKAALGAIKDHKEQNTAQMVDKHDLPRGSGGVSWRQQSRFDYATGKTGSKGAHKMSLFDKIRKEKHDVKTNRLTRPVAARPGMVPSVRAAPNRMVQSIVEERKRIEEDRKKERSIAASAVRPPQSPIRATGSRDEVGYDLIADREARLRAMKSKPAVSNLSEPTSPPIAGQKRTADQAGLTAAALEDLFDDDDLESDDEDDKALGTLPTTNRPVLKKPRPDVIKSSVRKASSPETLPHASHPAFAPDHRKLLQPSTDRPRSTSPASINPPGRVASPAARVASPKPVVKRRAAPSLFLTNKRVTPK